MVVHEKQVFESNDYRLTQQGTAFSLDDAIGQRGTILEFSQGVLEGSIAVADIRNLERLAQAQQQREGAEAQQQQTDDRAEYVAITQQVREEFGNVSAERVDIEVYLRTGKNGDRILAQSDHVQTLETRDQVKHYTESIRAKASQYQEDQALYKKFVSGIQKGQGTLIPYRVDLEIQFQARRVKIQNPERLLSHSEVTKTFSKEDPIKAQRYIRVVGELATMYEDLRGSPNQEAVNQSIPKLVQKKLADPVALQRVRQEEELYRRQQKQQGQQL